MKGKFIEFQIKLNISYSFQIFMNMSLDIKYKTYFGLDVTLPNMRMKAIKAGRSKNI